MLYFMSESKIVATEYIKLLRKLPDVKESSKLLENVQISTFGGKRRAEEMLQHFLKIREELDSSVGQITIVFANGEDIPQLSAK
jgi:hypothetical protein